ncbi:shieldin complex subunit 1 isoform X2 [Ochotona curzoniae]|uniref:shieldin complex subunit 1 isoform X2 n=1 Tax=Ochotona curzoniae TaxID=130825 RepID=UPI001B347D18|nr:shieldin complex subunit 1 isoform X2 [Ochotona curzoniae]
MAAQEAAAGSLSPESCVLELPSTYDISHFVLQRPSQEPSSKALAPVEFQSFPCSSDVDPAFLQHTQLWPWFLGGNASSVDQSIDSANRGHIMVIPAFICGASQRAGMNMSAQKISCVAMTNAKAGCIPLPGCRWWYTSESSTVSPAVC